MDPAHQAALESFYQNLQGLAELIPGEKVNPDPPSAQAINTSISNDGQLRNNGFLPYTRETGQQFNTSLLPPQTDVTALISLLSHGLPQNPGIPPFGNDLSFSNMGRLQSMQTSLNSGFPLANETSYSPLGVQLQSPLQDSQDLLRRGSCLVQKPLLDGEMNILQNGLQPLGNDFNPFVQSNYQNFQPILNGKESGQYPQHIKGTVFSPTVFSSIQFPRPPPSPDCIYVGQQTGIGQKPGIMKTELRPPARETFAVPIKKEAVEAMTSARFNNLIETDNLIMVVNGIISASPEGKMTESDIIDRVFYQYPGMSQVQQRQIRKLIHEILTKPRGVFRKDGWEHLIPEEKPYYRLKVVDEPDRYPNSISIHEALDKEFVMAEMFRRHKIDPDQLTMTHRDFLNTHVAVFNINTMEFEFVDLEKALRRSKYMQMLEEKYPTDPKRKARVATAMKNCRNGHMTAEMMKSYYEQLAHAHHPNYGLFPGGHLFPANGFFPPKTRLYYNRSNKKY